jgi:hypothetical protein
MAELLSGKLHHSQTWLTRRSLIKTMHFRVEKDKKYLSPVLVPYNA